MVNYFNMPSCCIMYVGKNIKNAAMYIVIHFQSINTERLRRE